MFTKCGEGSRLVRVSRRKKRPRHPLSNGKNVGFCGGDWASLVFFHDAWGLGEEPPVGEREKEKKGDEERNSTFHGVCDP